MSDMTAHPWDTGLTLWFESSVTEYFSPDIEAYCDILLKRVLPIFSDVASVYNDTAQKYRAGFSGSYRGSSDFEEQVREQAGTAALQFAEMKDVFVAVGVSGLFHLFEKQVYRHLNRDFERHTGALVSDWSYAKRLILLFTQRYEDHELVECMSLVSALQNKDLQELENLANSINHGANGRAYQALIASDSPVVAEARKGNDISTQTILKVDLDISAADVRRYRDAILAFWSVEGEFWASYNSFEKAKKPAKTKA